MTQINIFQSAGIFAENKDIAKNIRQHDLMPALARKEDVVLNFDGVESATQSFIHTLISEALRQYGNEALEKITFHKCNKVVKQLIGVVVDYMQEGMVEKK